MVAGLQKSVAKINFVSIHIQLYLTITHSKKKLYLPELMLKIFA